MARLFVHCAPTSMSLVRDRYGSATSLSFENPKLDAPRQLAGVLRRREPAGDVELRRRRGAHANGADVAALAQIELRRNPQVGVEVLLLLRFIGQHQHPFAHGRERGARYRCCRTAGSHPRGR